MSRTNPPKGKKVLTTPSIASTSTLGLALNTNRKLAILVNPSSTSTIYLGPTGVTSTAFSIALPPSPDGKTFSTYIDDCSYDAWYACTDTGTVSINVTETA